MKITAYDLKNVWNANRGDMNECASLEIRNRRALATARVAVVDDLQRWAKAINRISSSRFCTGKTATKDAPEGFVGTFDWLIKPDTITLIEEGTYDDHDPPIIPPDSPSPHREDYWGTSRQEIRFTDEEFLRCQIQGRLCLKMERFTKVKSMTPATKRRLNIHPQTDDFCQDWLTNGGPHPWATDAEIAEANAYVLAARTNTKEPLPSSFAAFSPKLT